MVASARTRLGPGRDGKAANAYISGEKNMRIMKLLLVFLFAITVVSGAVVAPTSARVALTQSQGSTALERGYRTGYSDGYQAGYSDQAARATRDYANKEDYKRADRAYVDAWGPVEDYRDGYHQGFEIGYAAGYERQSFNSSLPSGFKRRSTASSQPVDQTPESSTTPVDPIPNSNTTSHDPRDNPPDTRHDTASPADNGGSLSIPRDTVFLIELENSLSTDISQSGDRFQARVIEPKEYAGGVIEGRVTHVQRAGKLKGTAQLQLSFEQLRLPDNRTMNIHAEVVEVLPDAGSSGVGDVDREGGVRGKDSTKDDISKVGAATGIGAIIGAIAGGGKGAAIGAAVGGSVGTAGVLSSRGKDLRLAHGQQLRIRTSTDTHLQ
ncbi:MAG: hypothetical protein JWM21_1175 [Acidobacteria bacterium]|nr:hypothetical protein [Acidobacteriota bacterium]